MSADNEKSAVELQAEAVRLGSFALNALSSDEKKALLLAIADALGTRRAEILAANARDLEAAAANNLTGPLLKRLQLSDDKINTLVDGVRKVAAMPDPVGRAISTCELDGNLVLTKQTVPIGVLLVVFESRPDSFPQIASLALSAGNGLLLKGGKEAEHSNAALHTVITEAITAATGGAVPPSVLTLVTSRAAIEDLLKLDHLIDLVIPRGGNALVQHIKRSTSIPVLGHADGVCHVYIHPDADPAHALVVATESKLNYPAACNAAETLLLHRDLLTKPHGDGGSVADYLLSGMRAAGVLFLRGPAATAAGVLPDAETTSDLHVEYGDAHMTVEVVDSLADAITYINAHSSHHTEAILTSDAAAAALFQRQVDSACVFHNSSTRFADGYRFGLGAEVGISTSRIHARGPVGTDGLLTTKWTLSPRPVEAQPGREDVNYATIGQFQSGERIYTHHYI